MFRVLVLLTITLFSFANARYSVPDWVLSLGQSNLYPTARFITGFGVSDNEASIGLARKITQATDAAKADLISRIHVSIRSRQTNDTYSRLDKKDLSELDDQFNLQVTTSGAENIDQLHLKLYDDRRSHQVFALAWIDKSAIESRCELQLSRLYGQLGGLYGSLQVHLAAGDTAAGREQSFAIERVGRQIQKLVDESQQFDVGLIVPVQDQELLRHAAEVSDALWNRSPRTYEEVSGGLVRTLSRRLPSSNLRILVTAPTFMTDGNYVVLSNTLRRLLERDIQEATLLDPVLVPEQARFPSGPSSARAIARNRGSQYVLTGTIVPQDGKISVNTRVWETAGGTVVADAWATLPDSAVNKADLRRYNDELGSDSLPRWSMPSGDSGLHVTVSTSRGEDSLVLEKDDRFTIFLNVNRPCYVRLIYQLSNNLSILPDISYENLYFDCSEVHRTIELHETFRVGPPFGREQLSVAAALVPFPELSIHQKQIEGTNYLVVMDNDAMQVMKDISEENKSIGFDEKQIYILTVDSF